MEKKEAREARAHESRRPLDSAAAPLCEVSPEERAAAGLARWPWPVVSGRRGLLWATVCPRCGVGAIGLIPPAPPFEAPYPVTACTALGCPPPAVREAMHAVLEGRTVAVGEDDARRLGRFLARVLPDLWSGRTGRDPRRALWAARFSLEEVALRPELVELALEALARRRGWPVATVAAVLGRAAA